MNKIETSGFGITKDNLFNNRESLSKMANRLIFKEQRNRR